MGSSEGLVVGRVDATARLEVLVGQVPLMYHQVMMSAVDVLDPEKVASVVTLAGTYADQVRDSLPEDDPEILQAGLVGAFVSFFVDALLATTATG